MRNNTVNLKKMLRFFILLLFVAVCFFTYDYYSVSNLNSLGEELIKFEYDSENNTVAIHSDYDVPFITSIRYTTDGSIPTKDSAEYDEPLILENEGRSGTVIRAAIFRGGKYTDVYTKTFFSSPSALNDGIYTICISTDADNLYSDEKGIFALGAATQEEANANENIPKDPRSELRANYYGRGIEWERPANVEIYSSDGNIILNKNVGMRVTGANSRRFPVKSLRIYARSGYDGYGTFDLNILEQYTRGLENQVTTYNHLDLRMGGNNFYYSMLPDTIMRQIAYDSGFDTVGVAQPAVVYINGEYYGLVWIQPDYCRRNIAEMAGLHKDSDIRTVKGFEGSATGDYPEDYYDYMEMYEFASLADFTDESNREKLEQMLDLDNCFMYYALQMYSNNNDWPTNNYGLWRCIDPKTSDTENKYADGRWRFFLYDTDNAFATFVDQHEGFDFILGLKVSPMMVNLMKSEEYKERFINIYCDLLSTTLKSEHTLSVYEKLRDSIEPEMKWRAEEQKPIAFDEDYRAIMLFKIEYFMQNRPAEIYNKIRDYLGATDKYSLNISEVPQGVTVKLNTLEFINGDSFTGTYYADAPAELGFITADGYGFDYWEINGEKYYQEQIYLDSSFVENGACDIKIFVSPAESVLKFKSVSWGSVAKYADIYNPGTRDVSAAGYVISTDEYGLEGFALPALTLSPGESFRIYFDNDKSASLGEYKCGINVKEEKCIYIVRDGNRTDRVYIPEYIDGYILEKSEYDGSWKYSLAEEGTL